MKLLTTMCAALLLMAGAAQAQQPQQCGQYAQFRSVLADKYGEHRRHVGLASNGQAMLEIYTADDLSSFTILVVLLSGEACVVAEGEAWSDVKDERGNPS